MYSECIEENDIQWKNAKTIIRCIENWRLSLTAVPKQQVTSEISACGEAQKYEIEWDRTFRQINVSDIIQIWS